MFFSEQYIVFAGLGGLVLLLLWNIRLEIKIHRLLAGKNGSSLEDSIVGLGKRQEIVEQFKREMENYLTNVEKRLRGAVRGVGTVRFNPFKGDGSGGNQSFATALLTEEGDGVILSSLYARDRVSVFAKPIVKHTSPHELTEEENAALEDAKKKSTHWSKS